MASEDDVRPFAQWYVEALTRAVQALVDGKDVGAVIRNEVDGLSESKARNVLQVKLGDDAVRAHKQMMGGGDPSQN
jgi:hypothetical protein